MYSLARNPGPALMIDLENGCCPLLDGPIDLFRRNNGRRRKQKVMARDAVNAPWYGIDEQSVIDLTGFL